MRDLDECWRIRNAAATSMTLCEEQMRHAVQQASVQDLVAFIETFAPSRSAGPDWTRTFEPLAERLRVWCDSETMASLAEQFRAKGMPWMAVANALSVESDTPVRSEPRHPAWARLPAFASA